MAYGTPAAAMYLCSILLLGNVNVFCVSFAFLLIMVVILGSDTDIRRRKELANYNIRSLPDASTKHVVIPFVMR